MGRGASAASVGLAGLVLIASGATAGLILAPERPPTNAVAVVQGRSAPVSSQSYDDARPVSATAAADPATELTLSDAGRVTRTDCSPGGQFVSGTSPLTVEDRPVVALATSMPLWRNLRPGDRGDDVRSLQEELARLGYDLLPDGDYGANTRAAVIELFSRVGVAKPDGTLSTARVLWLPSAKVTIAECPAPLGATVGSGPIAKTTATLASLHVSMDESVAVPGARVLRYRDNSAPVAADGTVTDSTFLAAVAAGAEYQSASAEAGQGVSLTLEYALAEPLQVAVVPPGALLDIQDAAACVRVNGKAQSVQVVASQLGQTMVLFEDGATPSAVDLPERSVGGVAAAEGCA